MCSIFIKPPSHSEEDHEVRTTSCIVLSNSIHVVGTWSKLLKYHFHVHTTLLLRRCQVLTAYVRHVHTRFFLRVHHARTRSNKFLPPFRLHHALTTFLPYPSSPYKYYYICCSTSLNLENITCEHRLKNMPTKTDRGLGRVP